MSKILPIIKQETSNRHQALESSYPFNQLMGHTLNEDNYGETLQILFSTHSWLEPQIEQYLPDEFLSLINYRSHASALADDLRTLRHKPKLYTQQDSLDLPETLGALYVITGSFLGAKMIQRQLQSVPNLPLRFYSRAAESSTAWPIFRKEYEQFCASQNMDVERVVRGANLVFGYLLKCAKKVSQLQAKMTA